MFSFFINSYFLSYHIRLIVYYACSCNVFVRPQCKCSVTVSSKIRKKCISLKKKKKKKKKNSFSDAATSLHQNDVILTLFLLSPPFLSCPCSLASETFSPENPLFSMPAFFRFMSYFDCEGFHSSLSMLTKLDASNLKNNEPFRVFIMIIISLFQEDNIFSKQY